MCKKPQSEAKWVMGMFRRWFVGAYSVSMLTGFATAPWLFPNAAAPIIGLYFIPFALPFVLLGSLLGKGMQWGIERYLPPGWQRTAILSCLAGLAGAFGMHLVTGSAPCVTIAFLAAVTGAVFSQHHRAWRRAWLAILVSAGLASALVIGLLGH